MEIILNMNILAVINISYFKRRATIISDQVLLSTEIYYSIK